MLPLSLAEASWQLDQRPDLTATLLPWASDDAHHHKWAYAAFLEAPQPQALVSFISSTRVPEENPFTEYLCLHGDRIRDLASAAFVLDTFYLSDAAFVAAPASLDFSFESQPFVDCLLQSTDGTLIWHHQLEQLYGLFSDSPDDCLRFRRGINGRRAATFDQARSLALSSGIMLADVIEERMRFGAVRRPSFRAARLLCTCLGIN